MLVRKAGHPALCRTFRSEKEAQEWGKKAEREIERGKRIEQGGLTVGKAVQAFRDLREQGRRPIRSSSNEFYMLRHLESGLGKVPVDKLTPQRLAEWCRERADDGAGPYTINMEVSKLATALKYAAISLHCVLPDVVGAARPLLEYSGLIGPGKARTRRPSPQELDAVIEHLSPQMADLVRFAIASAMRRAEICRIRWSDLDVERRLVMIRDRKHPKAKKGNHQWVPLIDRTGFDAWEILNRQPRCDERIFPLNPETVSDRFTAACRAAGVHGLHLHDMRHEGTSRMFEAGMSIEQVAVVTGHADWRNLKRYTNLRPESLTDTRRDTPQRHDSPRSAPRRPGM